MLAVLGNTPDVNAVVGIVIVAGYIPNPATVRGPEYANDWNWTDAQTWHHEGGLLPGCGTSEGRLVFWSNEPTEFRSCRTGDLLTQKSGDVVLINNALVEHRMPRLFTKDRKFVRMWIK